MKSKKIIVVGSTNLDMVVKSDHIPAPGETVLSGAFFMNPGGNGTNQAVTISRLGGEVVFITKLGNDIFGKQFSQLFKEEGINTSYLISDENLQLLKTNKDMAGYIGLLNKVYPGKF